MQAGKREMAIGWLADRPWLRNVAFAGALLISALGLSLDRTPYDLFVVGLLAGGLIVFGCAYLLMPEKSKLTLETTAQEDDEIQTARSLDRLGRFGWRPVHDRALGDSVIDHIVVGPAGVYAIDTMTLEGAVSVKRGRVAEDGAQRPEVARKARDAATELAELVKGAECEAAVHALVVLWGDFAQGLVETANVTYVAGEQLVDWLHARPPKLSGAEIDQLVEAIAGPPSGAKLSLVS